MQDADIAKVLAMTPDFLLLRVFQKYADQIKDNLNNSLSGLNIALA